MGAFEQLLRATARVVDTRCVAADRRQLRTVRLGLDGQSAHPRLADLHFTRRVEAQLGTEHPCRVPRTPFPQGELRHEAGVRRRQLRLERRRPRRFQVLPCDGKRATPELQLCADQVHALGPETAGQVERRIEYLLGASPVTQAEERLCRVGCDDDATAPLVPVPARLGNTVERVLSGLAQPAADQVHVREQHIRSQLLDHRATLPRAPAGVQKALDALGAAPEELEVQAEDGERPEGG